MSRAEERAFRRRIRWWGRLESRMAIALGVLGLVLAGATAYLVSLSVAYFEDLGSASDERVSQVGELALGFHHGLVLAKREGFDARARGLAIRLDATPQAQWPAAMQDQVDAWKDAESVVARPKTDGAGTIEPLRAVPGEQVGRPADTRVNTVVEEGDVEVTVEFVVPAEVGDSLQVVGALVRETQTVDLEGRRVERDQLERATVRAVSAATVLVLLVAIAIGLFVARTMTRKVTKVSSVMQAVAGGQGGARAGDLGDDELGRLASDFDSMLDQLDEARGRVEYLQRIAVWQEMARRIAHEIKNPLTPIQLAAQQLRDKDPGTDEAYSHVVRESCELVLDEVEGLRRMVTSFSQFAKVPEVNLSAGDLRRVLTEFERAYGHLSERAEDRLEVIIPPEAVPVLADRQLLKQALVNLVENATLSAREHGAQPVHVDVRLEVDRRRALIRVEDNGPGVPQDRRERVFEPYETTRARGTGLGLPIVKKIVLDHGGEVWVEPGKTLGGACFVMAIPLAGAERHSKQD